MGQLAFFLPMPPDPTKTRGVPFEVVVEVSHDKPGALVVVTLRIDGVARPTEVAPITGGVGYAYFHGVTVMTAAATATLVATAEHQPGFVPATLVVNVEAP